VRFSHVDPERMPDEKSGIGRRGDVTDVPPPLQRESRRTFFEIS